jgi:hypothetical protein
VKKLIPILILLIVLSVLALPAGAQGTDNPSACWGQASAVFAQTGVMGEHASQQPTPRMGLRNLARSLYEAGAIPDDTIQALGVFVVSISPDLTVEACM